jgi:hypothetical protein
MFIRFEHAACLVLQNSKEAPGFKRAAYMSHCGFSEKLKESSWAVYLISKPLRRAVLLPGGPSAALITRRPFLQASEEAIRVGIQGISRQPGIGAGRHVPPISSIAVLTSTARRKQFAPTAFDNHRSSMLPFKIPEGILKMKRLAPMKTGRRLCSFNLIRCSFKQESCAQPKLVAGSPPWATPN